MRRQGTDDAAVAVAVSERLLLSHAKQVRDTAGVSDNVAIMLAGV